MIEAGTPYLFAKTQVRNQMGTQDVVTSNSSPTGAGKFLVGVGLRMKRTKQQLVMFNLLARSEGRGGNAS